MTLFLVTATYAQAPPVWHLEMIPGTSERSVRLNKAKRKEHVLTYDHFTLFPFRESENSVASETYTCTMSSNRLPAQDCDR